MPVSADKPKLALQSYGGSIEDINELKPLYPSTPIEELKRRYAEEGVLWVKGLLARDIVNNFRREYFSFISQGSDMLKPDTDVAEGIFGGSDPLDFMQPGAVRVALGLPDDGVFVQNAIASHDAPFYRNFKTAAGEALEPFVGKLCDFKDSWCLPRSLLRCAVPGSESTPVHYDQIFLRAGPPTSITAWVPLGDIELDGGGLIYLEKSHRLGEEIEAEFSGRSGDLSEEEKISAFNRNMEKGGWLDRNASDFGQKSQRSWLAV